LIESLTQDVAPAFNQNAGNLASAEISQNRSQRSVTINRVRSFFESRKIVAFRGSRPDLVRILARVGWPRPLAHGKAWIISPDGFGADNNGVDKRAKLVP